MVLFPGLQGYPGFTSRGKILARFGQPARTCNDISGLGRRESGDIAN